MSDELDLDLDDQEDKINNRIRTLSEKVKSTAQERDELATKQKSSDEARAKAEKERDFFKDFSQLSSKYPAASSYQEKILEKVNAGYTAEDATLSILAKEGKLTAQSAPEAPLPRADQVAGGSAATTVSDSGDKELRDMTTEEKRSALLEMEKGGTDLLKRS